MSFLDVKAIDNPVNKYKVESIPMDKIWSDESFNCRGHIAPADIIDLARDIAERGLDQPIVVQPIKHPHYDYKVVAGHRRHLAFQFNNMPTIPAYVRPDLDELTARMLNLRENLHRANLNVKQEAHALKFFLDYKVNGRNAFSVAQIAEIFGQSRGWVNNRQALLTLPDDIQDVAAAGLINHTQIKALVNIKNRDQLYATVRRMKEQRLRGEKVKVVNSIRRSEDVMRPKERDRNEINELQEMIYDTLGPCLITRVMAWCQGEISTAVVMNDLQKHCKENNIPFTMPTFITDAMKGKAS